MCSEIIDNVDGDLRFPPKNSNTYALRPLFHGIEKKESKDFRGAEEHELGKRKELLSIQHLPFDSISMRRRILAHRSGI
jgi:hypothetical protein